MGDSTPMAKKTFTKAELYELVWSRPRTALAKELGLSDVAIAKHCVRARVTTSVEHLRACSAVKSRGDLPCRHNDIRRHNAADAALQEFGRRCRNSALPTGAPFWVEH